MSSLDSMTSQERKDRPIFSGVINYFPDALAYIALISKIGNDKHNPGQPLHWSRDKSSDHTDCIARHLIDAGNFDPDGHRHSGFLAWRALANLQIELETAQKELTDQEKKVQGLEQMMLLSQTLSPSFINIDEVKRLMKENK